MINPQGRLESFLDMGRVFGPDATQEAYQTARLFAGVSRRRGSVLRLRAIVLRDGYLQANGWRIMEGARHAA